MTDPLAGYIDADTGPDFPLNDGIIGNTWYGVYAPHGYAGLWTTPPGVTSVSVGIRGAAGTSSDLPFPRGIPWHWLTNVATVEGDEWRVVGSGSAGGGLFTGGLGFTNGGNGSGPGYPADGGPWAWPGGGSTAVGYKPLGADESTLVGIGAGQAGAWNDEDGNQHLPNEAETLGGYSPGNGADSAADEHGGGGGGSPGGSVGVNGTSYFASPATTLELSPTPAEIFGPFDPSSGSAGGVIFAYFAPDEDPGWFVEEIGFG